jgi:peroxiredoxin
VPAHLAISRRSLLSATSAALLPIACASVPLPPSRSGQYVGDRLPAFAGVTVNGSEFDSNASLGMVLLVEFFDCKEGTRSLTDAAELYSSHRELVVVGISLDESLERTVAFTAQRGAKFPVLFDPKRTVAAELGVTDPGTSLARDRRGILRWIGDVSTPHTVEQAAAALLGESA